MFFLLVLTCFLPFSSKCFVTWFILVLLNWYYLVTVDLLSEAANFVFMHKPAKQDGILCTNIFHVNRYLQNMLCFLFCIDYPMSLVFFANREPFHWQILVSLAATGICLKKKNHCFFVCLFVWYLQKFKFFKVRLSPSKKSFYLLQWKLFKNDKNAFYIILKAVFVLKISKILSWLFVYVEKPAWLKRYKTSQPG